MPRKGATERPQAERRLAGSGGQERPGATTALTRGLLVAIGLDAVLAIVQLYVHGRLVASDGSYTSFCNVNGTINCDAVLASPYGMLFGISLSAWALLKDAALGALVLYRGRPGSALRTQSALLLAGLGVWSVVFTLYMAFLATWAVGAFCLLCAGMYVLNPIIAVLAWRLAESRLGAAGPLVTAPRVFAGAGAMLAVLIGIVTVQFNTAPASAAPLTPAEVRERDPRFFEWYGGLERVGPLPPARHVKGPVDAPITITEFSDFECAFCAKAFKDLRDLERRYPGRVRVVFHHFPLDSSCNPHVQGSMHQSACLAAIAAECAALQDKFWAYHDLLFDRQDELARPALIAYAATVGANVDAFVACLDDSASRARVREDAGAGADLGVTSTPTLIINGRLVEGALEPSAYDYVMAMELPG
jgi:protein-disulfide isomerase/uncharacterized membrane protein